MKPETYPALESPYSLLSGEYQTQGPFTENQVDGDAPYAKMEATSARIGHTLRKKFPGQSPYEAAVSAAHQLYPGLSIGRSTEGMAPGLANSEAEWHYSVGDPRSKNRQDPLAGFVLAKEGSLKDEASRDRMTGIYAHEILGHGGDQWRSRGNFASDVGVPNSDSNHFMLMAPEEGSREDDISALEPLVNSLQSPEAFLAAKAEKDRAAERERAVRGLQKELPTMTRSERASPTSPYSRLRSQ